MKEWILRTESLSVGYHGVPVLRDVALHLRPGQIMTLIGPNGAGKSTVLKSLIRQLTPVSGVVYLKRQNLQALSPNRLARTMAVVMTGRIDPELMTCRDVVSAGRYPYTGRLGLLGPSDRAAVEEALALVHLTKLAEVPFSHLSDGQRQRAMLAKAICQEPEILVLDEPTTYLDIRHKLELLTLLNRLKRQRRMAVILTLHELELAQKCSDVVLCVRDGHLDRSGTPEELFRGDYIPAVFQLSQGSYDPNYGSLELPAPEGEPGLFVIGGGGDGIPVYRRLQRQNLPFYAGILHENDVEVPVATALAARVITTPAFAPISGAALREASDLLRRCPRVVCCVSRFGVMNEGNRLLLEQAGDRLTTPEALEGGASDGL